MIDKKREVNFMSTIASISTAPRDWGNRDY